MASLQSAKPNIATIAKADEETLVAALTILITDVADFFNVGKNFNASQIQSTVYLMIECYPYFKIDDFVICFNTGKKGHYGKRYDSMDGNILLDWLNMYDDKRSADIEALRASEKKTQELELVKLHAGTDKKPFELPQEIKDFINRPPDNRRKEIKPPADIENPIKEILVDKAKRDIERWDRQFNNLYYKYKKLSVCNGGRRFLKVGGVCLGLQEYLQYKMKNK
ncbi:hypothetical protein [Pedobacter arcticus]|uniref:hypothetical protein n=1 Tax=Pedobacter arcticus TaxID=752140 RepID=UPI00030D4931|nr:hypothetical protein [Pedobacter arcticus]